MDIVVVAIVPMIESGRLMYWRSWTVTDLRSGMKLSPNRSDSLVEILIPRDVM